MASGQTGRESLPVSNDLVDIMASQIVRLSFTGGDPETVSRIPASSQWVTLRTVWRKPKVLRWDQPEFCVGSHENGRYIQVESM
jgi:hypothetical protein